MGWYFFSSFTWFIALKCLHLSQTGVFKKLYFSLILKYSILAAVSLRTVLQMLTPLLPWCNNVIIVLSAMVCLHGGHMLQTLMSYQEGFERYQQQNLRNEEKAEHLHLVLHLLCDSWSSINSSGELFFFLNSADWKVKCFYQQPSKVYWLLQDQTKTTSGNLKKNKLQI